MSSSAIPLQRVFRTGTAPTRSASNASSAGRRSISNGSEVEDPERERKTPAAAGNRQRTLSTLERMAQNVGRGTMTPQMLEYERQADERAKEMEAMNDERERMADMEAKIQREQERIAQEEYEMKQYYEAEALRHAEEMRLHQEGSYLADLSSLSCSWHMKLVSWQFLMLACIQNLDSLEIMLTVQVDVRKYQARLAEHERRIRDHEASSEAFAKVIAMPAQPGRARQVSFMAPGAPRQAGGQAQNGGA